MISGNIGVGKTTLAQNIVKDFDGVSVSYDGIQHMFERRELTPHFDRLTKDAMLAVSKVVVNQGETLVFDEWLGEPELRKEIIELGRKHNIPIYYVYLKCSIETSILRNERRRTPRETHLIKELNRRSVPLSEKEKDQLAGYIELDTDIMDPLEVYIAVKRLLLKG